MATPTKATTSIYSAIHTVRRSALRRRLAGLLAALLLIGGLLYGERAAQAQGIGFNPSFADGFLIVPMAAGGGLVLATLTLDFVQGSQLVRKGHASLGVTVTNLVLSTVEFGISSAVLYGHISGHAAGDFDPGILTAFSVLAAHGASSMAWSIYGITKRPRQEPAPPASARELPLIAPAPLVLQTPTGGAAGLALVGRF